MANLFTYFDGALPRLFTEMKVCLQIELNKNNIYCYFHDLCAKKMFEQKWFAGRHLLTFESQKLNYFGKKGGPAFWHYNVIHIWYCEKEKDKANKRILRSLSFDNNGLIKPSCGTVALYGPFVFFKIWQTIYE
jgi:hypothetical protein